MKALARFLVCVMRGGHLFVQVERDGVTSEVCAFCTAVRGGKTVADILAERDS